MLWKKKLNNYTYTLAKAFPVKHGEMQPTRPSPTHWTCTSQAQSNPPRVAVSIDMFSHTFLILQRHTWVWESPALKERCLIITLYLLGLWVNNPYPCKHTWDVFVPKIVTQLFTTTEADRTFVNNHLYSKKTLNSL